MLPDPTPSGLQAWLRDAAWPLWLRRGVDRRRGGFFEALDLSEHGCHASYRRLRVVARQIVVFSAAHAAGLPGADEPVRLGMAFIERHAAAQEGGYAWRFDLDHKVIDATRDLYDHAFVLLAFASASRVLQSDLMRARALDLLAWIDRAFTHPHGGFAESIPEAQPRRQNPHMHLLEALLAAHEAFGEAVFLDRASMLVRLFADRLFDAEAGALPEFFDDGLHPRLESGRFVVEPGHHYEWAWLLGRYRHLAKEDLTAVGAEKALRRFAVRHGVDPSTGNVRNTVWSDGTLEDGAFRLWPQAERLRSECHERDCGRVHDVPGAARTLAGFLLPDGLWHERKNSAGLPSMEPAPASSLYHLTGAILAV